ncbi:MAG: ferrous iron transporter B, partial [Oscillospiraceae bacterium]|nr:ferrous iron transporter B [Oscillospiraceae bacterium]
MFKFDRNPFEKAHEKYHKKRRDALPEDNTERFHDHYLTEDDHRDAEHIEKSHRFHTGHRLALVGNPNSGKTTLFNYLTGSSQYVGNWPGVTVEKKEGRSRMGGENITIVDLPGIYSLSPYTAEEIIARNYIIDAAPELIINIVDATNLERNLYLTTQLLELGRPVVVALNMVDMLRKRGDSIDAKGLRDRLGVPVVPVSASKGEGVMELMHKAHKYAEEQILPTPEDIYEGRLLDTIAGISTGVTRLCEKRKNPLRWSAVKLFEGDALTIASLRPDASLTELVEQQAAKVPSGAFIDRDMIVADARYKWICSVCGQVCRKNHSPDVSTISGKIDAVATHRYAALPVFLLTMGFIFWLTFGPLGSFCQKLTSDLVEIIIKWVRAGLAAGG